MTKTHASQFLLQHLCIAFLAFGPAKVRANNLLSRVVFAYVDLKRSIVAEINDGIGKATDKHICSDSNTSPFHAKTIYHLGLFPMLDAMYTNSEGLSCTTFFWRCDANHKPILVDYWAMQALDMGTLRIKGKGHLYTEDESQVFQFFW